MDTLTTPCYEELHDYSELEGLIDPKYLPFPDVSRCLIHRGDDGKIDGYCFIQGIIVIEPIWVAPEKRGHTIAPRLFGRCVDLLKREGTANGFYCRAKTDEVAGYLKRLGMREAGQVFEMDLTGG